MIEVLSVILIFLSTPVANETVHYMIVRSSQPHDYRDTEFTDSGLTLSQFVNNSSDYLTNDTTLIFSSGNYSLESKLIVENAHSFSMFAWPGSSSKVVITCGHDARFEFKNVSTVTVSGLEFVGCFENSVVCVERFELKDSTFLDNSINEVRASGTVLFIQKSTANPEGVAFVSVIDGQTTPQDLPDPNNCSDSEGELAGSDLSSLRMIGIQLQRSTISIFHSWFEGNTVGLVGGLIYDESGSNITITNTTFFNNSADNLYTIYACYCRSDCNFVTSGIVYASGPQNSLQIHRSKLAHNVGIVIFANNSNVLITHTKFIDNVYSGPFASVVYLSDSNVFIVYSAFSNNSGLPLGTKYSNVTIKHCEFISNNYAVVLSARGGKSLSFDHSKFINNTGGRIFSSINTSMIHLSHCEFVGNIASQHLIEIVSTKMINVTNSHFSSNAITQPAEFYYHHLSYPSLIYLDGFKIDLYFIEFVSNKANIGTGILSIRAVNTSIHHSEFINNTGSTILREETILSLSVSDQDNMNENELMEVLYRIVTISHCKFINNNNIIGSSVVRTENTRVTISYSEFIGNWNGQAVVYAYRAIIGSIDHCEFRNNTGSRIVQAGNTMIISVTHSEFVENFVTNSVLYFTGIMITVELNEFIQNEARYVLDIQYYADENLIMNNIFVNNSAAYDVYVQTACRPGLSLSLGSSRCIPCSNHWLRNLIGIVAAAFVAGIALVISMLALNLTVAIGTFNGILFYANTIAVNIDTYFTRFTSPNLATVFISWLNLDIGFDVCFINSTDNDVIRISKALLQLVFPSYVIVLVVIVIVASECSSKFAKMIGRGNPVAVLATMVLLSYSKFFNVIIASISLLYSQPAYGSRNVDVSRLGNVLADLERANNNAKLEAVSYFLLVISILIFGFGMIFTSLVFLWQWLLQYQHKDIFKWVRYQKLQLFLEPYHAPYTAKFRYWTGLLLFARVLLYLISVVNFSLDPRIDLMAVICIVCGLILLKGVTAKRIYKNWPLDVMETFIYFNLVAFSALTWYILDFGGNQVTLVYTSVMIIFILLLGVIVFHVLRYTRLYKYSFVEKAFSWTSSKLMEKKSKEQPPNDTPEELDGYRLERSAAGNQELPTMTYSVVEISQPT